MSFGRHLRALRDAAGLSRAALARRVGVPASTSATGRAAGASRAWPPASGWRGS
jgi:hypothetical protein